MSQGMKTAWSSLWRDKWLNLLCTLAIATSIFLLSVSLLAIYNLKAAAKRLPERFTVTVFFSESTPDDQIRSAINALRSNPSVNKVTYVSREDALAELKAALKDSEYVLEGLEGNPLPPSLEVSLRRSAATTQGVAAFIAETEKLPGVDDAYYASKALDLIVSARKAADTAGSAVAGFLGFAALFVCYSTMKILFYRRQAEIETLKLLGATRWFIRKPFLIEGAVIGTAAGFISLAALGSLYGWVYLALAEQFPLLKMVSVPVEFAPVVPLSGIIVGVLGSLIAVGRIRF